METPQKLAVVTGGAGFVGSHLCERLVKEGYRVISLDNYFTGSPENHVEGVEYRTGHTKAIAEHVPETPAIIFHLGEYARTEKSFEDIEMVWDLNKTGTFAVLEYCRRKKCKIIYAGSSTKFADSGEGRDQSPYAWTKATNTELVKNYSEWFGLEYAITYFYNVYGPREMSGPYGTLVRIFTELYRAGQALTITAPGTQCRNFTHVEDIVEGLILVANHGSGDGYGIGSDQSYSVLEVAGLFGGDIFMMPERKGTRLTSGVDNFKMKSLGWFPKKTLPEWIENTKKEIGSVQKTEQRILVFSTTYIPHAGPSEFALYDLMKALPKVKFDLITSKFSSITVASGYTLPNVTIHYIGSGKVRDKYLLPFSGAKKARLLKRTHSYIFEWSLFASYAALAALFSNSKKRSVPLLITLADQRVGQVPWYLQFLLKYMLGSADQIYALDAFEARTAITLSKRTTLVRSIGEGDAFANQVRIAYSSFLNTRL